MSMTGAIVNALAIVAGGAVGLLFQRGIPERVSSEFYLQAEVRQVM